MKMTSMAVILSLAASSAAAENIVFPPEAEAVNVKEKFGAKGDGVTDDTAALKKAFEELMGKNAIMYFPNGTYLVSDSVGVFGGKAHTKTRFMNVQGQSEAGTVIKLQDKCPGFGDRSKEKIVFSLYHGAKTGDAMHTYCRNITVDVGKGNPGAVGLRFMTNNTGAMYDVTVRTSDPDKAGRLGLDLRQAQNGPGLIKRITVEGFDRGVEIDSTFSLVFEHINCRDQREVGFYARGRLTMRGYKSRNRVPALIHRKHTHMTLIEAELTGGDPSNAAIHNEDPSAKGKDKQPTRKVFLRDVKVEGYGHTVKTADGKFVDGDIDEWYEGEGRSLFGCPLKTLRLPIKETPEIPWEEDLSKWVRVEDGRDKLQAAIDQAAAEGKTTVYFPRQWDKKKQPVLSKPVRVHGSVNRILGMENILRIDGDGGTLKKGSVVFTFEDLDGPFVLERFFNILKRGGWKGLYDIYLFENKSRHPIVIRNLGHGACLHKKPGASGEWFIEDMAGGRQALFGKGEKCWARQYNPESPDIVMCEVDGGQMWVLGMKTEGRSTHIIARNGAKVELLGGVSYQSWKNQPLDPPMFIVEDSDASFTFGFYHWNKPFTTIVKETVGSTTKTLPRTDLANYHLPIYRACAGAK